MNILTFDTEEWYIEKAFNGGRTERYQAIDRYQKSILDLLDEQKLKATFFCVGGLAKEFPEVVRSIADKGHEIGCHSNIHKFLYAMDKEALKADTETAIKSLEDVTGRKVVSYRAPAFSIGEKNKWALEVLAECGIERDASIYPAVRDYGGFAEFPSDEPCVVKVGSAAIKEFPASLTALAGHKMAYSGGGYFRFFPLSFIKHTMMNTDYNMIYLHIGDLEHHPYKMTSKEFHESYYKEPSTFKNRFTRMIKHSLGSSGAFDKMCSLVKSFDFVNIETADSIIEWDNSRIITL